jgi:hypothetical protein
MERGAGGGGKTHQSDASFQPFAPKPVTLWRRGRRQDAPVRRLFPALRSQTCHSVHALVCVAPSVVQPLSSQLKIRGGGVDERGWQADEFLRCAVCGMSNLCSAERDPCKPREGGPRRAPSAPGMGVSSLPSASAFITHTTCSDTS